MVSVTSDYTTTGFDLERGRKVRGNLKASTVFGHHTLDISRFASEI